MSTRVFLVEDDESMGVLLEDFLETNGFQVHLFRNGKSALENFTKADYQICILDVMLPEVDGFTLAENIRKRNKSIPIIFLTAKVRKDDKIKGFAIGIDDYVTKPFDEDELLCRIRSILHRYQIGNMENENTNLKIGQFEFDYGNLNLSLGDYNKRLTQKECDVLYLLSKYKNQVVKRDDILLNIWGDKDYFNGRSMDVFIVKLRKYLKADASVSIENVPKVGFILKDR